MSSKLALYELNICHGHPSRQKARWTWEKLGEDFSRASPMLNTPFTRAGQELPNKHAHIGQVSAQWCTFHRVAYGKTSSADDNFAHRVYIVPVSAFFIGPSSVQHRPAVGMVTILLISYASAQYRTSYPAYPRSMVRPSRSNLSIGQPIAINGHCWTLKNSLVYVYKASTSLRSHASTQFHSF